jgi:L-lactate dehydrogenase complex protein LldF
MTDIHTENYKTAARKGIADKNLQNALSGFQHRIAPATAQRYLSHREGPQIRQMGHAIRMHAVEHLDQLLPELADKITARGESVYFAEDADAAVAYAIDVAREYKVQRVVKGKSMVTEEIGLNRAMEAEGSSPLTP